MLPPQGVPLSPYTGVPGWDTSEEDQALSDYAELVPQGGSIVELGCEFGRSAAAFCRGADHTVKIYSIDLWPENHPQVGNLAAAYRHNITQAGFASRFENKTLLLIRSDSTDAGNKWGSGDIDLLFIDADHTFEGALTDILSWYKHVKIDGYIIFHDCISANNPIPHILHKAVEAAVNMWLEDIPNQFEELPRVDSLRIFKRIA